MHIPMRLLYLVYQIDGLLYVFRFSRGNLFHSRVVSNVVPFRKVFIMSRSVHVVDCRLCS